MHINPYRGVEDEMASTSSEQAYKSIAHLRVAIGQFGGNVKLPVVSLVH